MPLAVDFYRADAASACSEDPLEAFGRPQAPTGLDAVAAALRLQPRHHVVVVGGDSLALALDLWRAGFTHVGCAPHSLDCIAHGAADALVVERVPDEADLSRIIARARFMLRDGGWLVVRLAHSEGRALPPAMVAQLDAAGFERGVGLVDAEGRWITAQRRRPPLRLV